MFVLITAKTIFTHILLELMKPEAQEQVQDYRHLLCHEETPVRSKFDILVFKNFCISTSQKCIILNWIALIVFFLIEPPHVFSLDFYVCCIDVVSILYLQFSRRTICKIQSFSSKYHN